MNLSDLDRLLHATLPGQGGRMSVTVTDLPIHELGVRELIAKAAEVAKLKGAALISIELPRSRYPAIGAAFGDVPVNDCGRSGVLRLVYGAPLATIAA